MPSPGPSVLGRGVVVRAGSPPPSPWAGAPVVTVDEATLDDPSTTVTALHTAWSARRPVVVALAVDPAAFREPQTWDAAPWTLAAGFEPWFDRLHFLVWANNYDARAGDPVWWWARKAERAGATATDDGVADVELPSGAPAWIDGGPRGPLDDVGAAVVHRESVELGRLVPAPDAPAPRAELAPDQVAAVAHGAGPARVVAPAGSGKTRVLTERLRHLVVDRGVEREVVLAVAYNRQAQEELEGRTLDFRPRARTLNSLGYAVVSRALGATPRVLEERDVRALVERFAPTGARRLNTDRIGPYLEALSEVRLALRDPELVEAERDDVPGLAAMFEPYRQALRDRDVVDFDEQIYLAVELLLRDGRLRHAVQGECRHLLVDEFQDLTPAHVLMLRLLGAPALDVFGVGDDDQVIYGHAGADPRFLIEFDRLFPGGADHPLEVNYRCPVAVVDAARHLLSYNRRRVAKVIRPGPDAVPSDGGLSVARHAPGAGADALVDVVRGWLDAGVESRDVAVLARVNSLLLAPHVALAERGIPVDSVLRPDVLSRTGLRAALAYLRIGAAPGSISGADLDEVYRRPSRGFPNWIRKWFRDRMSIDDLRAVATRLDDAKVAAKVESFASDLELVAAAVAGGTTADALTVIRDGIGLGDAMSLLDSGGGEGSSHLDDLEALTQVAALHPDPATFGAWLQAVFHREATPGGVALSTVHRVKGREWDRVAVFGVTAGIVPHRLADDVEEERRVLHVAITRARRAAVVLTDSERPSPFLDELTGTAPHDRPEPTDAGRARRGATSASHDAPPPRDGSPEAAAAEAALRQWRLQRAKRDGVPAYVVFHDATLVAIAARRPRTLAGLRGISGIGPTKLERYGDDVIAVLDAATTDC
ncbi:MAG TPA: ATP-dependent DNA helicase UvrD2 [Acidimicrobiia bacterium]